MALPTNIETLLSGQVVEWARIELKETWDPQASLKTICAFANDIDNWGGGYIVIGVRDEANGRELIGVPPEKVDVWLKDMLNKCKLIQPPYMPITEVCTHEDKTFIVVWAPGGSQRPYSSPKHIGEKSERIRWIRKMASTVAPSHSEDVDLYTLANNVPFDDRVNHEAEVSDLSLPLIKSYLKEVGSSLYGLADTMDFTELCRSMNIVDGPAEYTRPKNVGLLFFSPNPERFFPSAAHIDVVELPEGEGGDLIYEHTFSGPLDAQLRDALRYLQNNVISEVIEKIPNQAESLRFFNYPYAAIEEALANAIYHKGYDTREPIEVRVLPDRIEILSHPGADRSISISNLRHFRAAGRRYRNRRVGEFLKELRLTEGRNTGIHKMLRALSENGSPDPLLETDEERVYFLATIYARNSDRTSGDKQAKAVDRIKDRQNRELDFFSLHPCATLTQASLDLGVKPSTLSRDIATLKVKGRLKRVGANRNGQWIVS